MQHSEIIPIERVVKNYELLIFDIWGVFHNGLDPFKNSKTLINKFIEDGKKIVFLSNTPRPSKAVAAKFTDWGFNTNKILFRTSGDAVREIILEKDPRLFITKREKIYHLGEDRNHEILENLNVIQTNDINEADLLLISAYSDPEENLGRFDDILKKLAGRNIPAICSNPDIVAHLDGKVRYCAGYFGKIYTDLGGTVFYFGKPEASIFESVINKFIISKDKIIMVGDTIETDILGANRIGIDSCLVLSGNGISTKKNLEQLQIPLFTNLVSTPKWISEGFV